MTSTNNTTSSNKVTGCNNIKSNVIEWNPWIGCRGVSYGCLNCPYNNSKQPAKFNKSQYYIPVRQTRKYNESLGKNTLQYKIPSGSVILVCNKSDFFLPEANYYRKRAWRIIKERKDILFRITTKYLDNFYINLPEAYTFDNILLSVSIEDQYTADIRIPQLLNLPVKHRGIEISPLLDGIDIRKYLSTGLIDEVTVSGEIAYKNTKLNKPITRCDLDIVLDIAKQCKKYDTHFKFISTGTKIKLDDINKASIYNLDEQQALAEFISENRGLLETSKSFEWSITLEDQQNIELMEQAHKIYYLAIKSGKITPNI